MLASLLAAQHIAAWQRALLLMRACIAVACLGERLRTLAALRLPALATQQPLVLHRLRLRLALMS